MGIKEYLQRNRASGLKKCLVPVSRPALSRNTQPHFLNFFCDKLENLN